MGKAARAKRERREQRAAGLVEVDRHEPDAGEPIPLWSQDASGRVSAPRGAYYWHELPGRRVACDLCWRACELAPGETGWCKIRTNAGGALRLPQHGVVTTAQPHVGHYFHFRNHARYVWIGTTSCTARCSFCTSTTIAWAPERLAWGYGERALGNSGGWAYHRAMLHPSGIPHLAREWACSGVYLGISEPLLTFEFTYDAARLAKGAGLWVAMDTNGFAPPAAVRAIAPFVDCVYLGVKGHADETFYEKRMRSPGAVPHVLAAAKAWRETAVALALSDVVTPPHWLPEEAAVEQMKRLYTWIAEELGPRTPLEVRAMIRPEQTYADWWRPLLPRDAAPGAEAAFLDRLRLARATARACGLEYVYSLEDRAVWCHQCGGALVGRIGSVDFDLHVSPAGICAHCGGETPIIGISREEWEAIQAEEAMGAAPATSDSLGPLRAPVGAAQ